MPCRELLLCCCLLAASQQAFAQQRDVCTPAGSPASLPAVPEASGIAAGRGSGAPLFAINDSGKPLLTVLDRSGSVVRQIPVSGARLVDWEDVSVGPCDSGACVYIADLGDNEASRRNITLLRMPQPSATTQTVEAESFELVYPDGPHNAESVFITADGQIFIVTKARTGAALYRAPHPLTRDTPGMLTRVADLDAVRVTDADTSADGRWTAIRTNDDLLFFKTGDLVAGRTGGAIRVDLRPLGEPQGEGVTFGAGSDVYLVGEGGGRRRPGTFMRLECRLPESAGGR
jgi:hypothetical protein